MPENVGRFSTQPSRLRSANDTDVTKIVISQLQRSGIAPDSDRKCAMMNIRVPPMLLAMLVSACGPATIFSDGTPVDDLDQQAFFTDFPAPLFLAASESCNGPGDVLVRVARGNIRCEVLPSPPDAATLILAYDGTIEDLPKYVIAFDTELRDDGYLVRNQAYISVPQLNGGEKRIKSPDRRRTRYIREIFAAAGGTIVTP